MIVNFPLDEDPNVSVIAWTTTPWTLPSNLALCVNADMDYVKIVHKKDNKVTVPSSMPLQVKGIVTGFKDQCYNIKDLHSSHLVGQLRCSTVKCPLCIPYETKALAFSMVAMQTLYRLTEELNCRI